jgi:transcription elongation factor Elf1
MYECPDCGKNAEISNPKRMAMVYCGNCGFSWGKEFGQIVDALRAELAAANAEIARLRVLVRDAYEEGESNGSSNALEPNTCGDYWETSAARAALEAK